MNRPQTPDYLWQVLEAQADDLFALYQLAQLLAEAADLDELIQLAVPQIVRVCDSPYAALFLPVERGSSQELLAWIGPDVGEAGIRAEPRRRFPDSAAATLWFQESCGLDSADCMVVPLEVGRPAAGVLLLAAASRDGFTHHEHHLIATMTREVARFLQLTLARSDLRRQQSQAEQMQADFVTAVSHELRTPLALLQASIDSLTHLPLTPEQRSHSLDDIAHSTRRLTRIVDTILNFSRVEESRWDLSVRPVDLAEVVARAMDDCGPASGRLRVKAPVITVRADPERLLQSIVNIFDNALKYSPRDQPVFVRAYAWPARGVAWLQVRDRGAGIPEEDQPFLFQKFFRARDVRESATAGTGLGLYMAKRLVEAQGGSIRLRSRSGQGTAVRICLPLA
jgi:two-component system phosphate regulon sensor histidine kinase PhoR